MESERIVNSSQQIQRLILSWSEPIQIVAQEWHWNVAINELFSCVSVHAHHDATITALGLCM